MSSIGNVAKIAAKTLVVSASALVGVEAGWAGGKMLALDIIDAGNLAPKPVIVATKGFGPWKKAIVATTHPFSGEVSKTIVKIGKEMKR